MLSRTCCLYLKLQPKQGSRVTPGASLIDATSFLILKAAVGLPLTTVFRYEVISGICILFSLQVFSVGPRLITCGERLHPVNTLLLGHVTASSPVTRQRLRVHFNSIFNMHFLNLVVHMDVLMCFSTLATR